MPIQGLPLTLLLAHLLLEITLSQEYLESELLQMMEVVIYVSLHMIMV